MKEINRPWNQWDNELNSHGAWLLVGSLSCGSLPAIPGLIGLFALFYYAIVQSEPKARAIEIFKRRDELKRKYDEESMTAEEATEYYLISGSLTVNRKRRNTVLFKLGCGVWACMLAYQFAKMLRAHNLVEQFFGQ